MTTQGHWQALLKLAGNPEWSSRFPLDWLEFHCTREKVEEFRELIRPWLAEQEKIPITEAAQKLGLAMVPVNTAADVPLNQQFIHRGFFQQVDGVAYPTVPYKLSATPVRITAPAPALNDMGGA